MGAKPPARGRGYRGNWQRSDCQYPASSIKHPAPLLLHHKPVVDDPEPVHLFRPQPQLAPQELRPVREPVDFHVGVPAQPQHLRPLAPR